MTIHKYIGLAIIIVGVGLIAQATPYLMYELSLVPGNHAYSNLARNQEWTEAELEVIESSRLTALTYRETGKARSELGSVYLYRAQRETDPELRIMRTKIALKSLEESLKTDPLMPFVWLRIASANILLGPSYYPDAVEAWRRSVKTAPFEPFMILQQIHSGLILFEQLESHDVHTLKVLVEKAFRWRKGRLRAYVRANNLQDLIGKLKPATSPYHQYLTQ